MSSQYYGVRGVYIAILMDGYRGVCIASPVENKKASVKRLFEDIEASM